MTTVDRSDSEPARLDRFIVLHADHGLRENLRGRTNAGVDSIKGAVLLIRETLPMRIQIACNVPIFAAAILWRHMAPIYLIAMILAHSAVFRAEGQNTIAEWQTDATTLVTDEDDLRQAERLKRRPKDVVHYRTDAAHRIKMGAAGQVYIAFVVGILVDTLCFCYG